MGNKLGNYMDLNQSAQSQPEKKQVNVNNNPDVSTKKEKKSKSKKRIDRSTSIDENLLTSTGSTIQYLVGFSSIHSLNDQRTTETSAFAWNGNGLSNAASNDVLELRKACIQRGIISAEQFLVKEKEEISSPPAVAENENSDEPAAVANDEQSAIEVNQRDEENL